MTIDELYLNTIEKLNQNIRPHIKLTPELISELKSAWQKAIAGPNIDQSALTKIFCILDNTQNYTSELNELFLETFQKIRDHELLIYILAASQKHIVNESLRTGVMVPIFYFDQLRELLKNKNPEVLEWTLRTIESMGPLSLRLKNEIREAKPGFLKLFNTHQKSATQIIELLENQWKRML
ncbi:MAG: hypothetical protein EHM20_11470 [Alphaproteobacteria bacterium]|nr:MAG: hypothetical protein EHM20_11470 [Alphaproteobacteria bacterium]